MGGGKVRNDAAIAIGNWNGSNLFGHPTPFLSRRFSFNFSIVALLQRKYYPRLHTWIQELRRTENLRRGSLSEIRRSRLRIYMYIYIYEGRCESSSNDRSIPRILDHGIRDVSMETDGLSTRGKYFRKIFKRHDHFASDIFYLINEQSVLYLLCPWPQEERERENNGADTSTL